MDRSYDRFLPPRPAGAASPAEHAAAHLRALLAAVSTYVPRSIYRFESAGAPPAPTCERLPATLLYADVSGFTALSEQLAGLGREGAEQLSLALNRYFTVMQETLDPYRGTILKFGGDALVVAFSGSGHVRTAASAALALQQTLDGWMAESALGAMPLRLSIGLGSGSVALFRLGDEQRHEIALLGSAVAEVAHCEEMAEAGMIVAAARLAGRLPGPWVARREAGLLWLDPSAAPDPPPLQAEEARRPLPTTVQEALPALDRLSRYLPDGLLQRIVIDPGSPVEGEHRPVTVLFAHLDGLPSPLEDEARALLLQDHFMTMMALIRRYGGALNKIDIAPSGHRMMVLFGAPLGHEKNEERALLAAEAMQEAVEDLNGRATSRLGRPVALTQSIGVNSGMVFAGTVGSERRREYSVLGDEVNLAARIQGRAAAGELLASSSTVQAARAVASEPLPPVRLKGKRAPVPLFRVTGRGQVGVAAPLRPLVGRGQELERLRGALAGTAAGAGRAIYLHGEPGAGKSRLAAELTPEIYGFQQLDSRAQPYDSAIPYHPWRPLLRDLFEVEEGAPVETQRRKVTDAVRRLLPEQLPYVPLLSLVLGIDFPESPESAMLPAEMRQQRLPALMSDLLRAAARRRPLFLRIDDSQWLDALSAAALAFLARRLVDVPIFLLLLGRETPEQQFGQHGADLPSLPNFQSIALGELDPRSALALAHQCPGGASLSESAHQLILERAGGNPLYIETLAEALASEQKELPESLHGLIMSRLDRLPEGERRLLQVASVVGARFDAATVGAVYPYEDEATAAIPERLRSLAAAGVVEREPGAPVERYLFRQPLVHEVSYESLLFARRRALHHGVAQHLESAPPTDGSERAALLSHHYYYANAWEPALRYTLAAGESAQKSYANDAAIKLFERALAILDEEGSVEADRAEIYRSLSDVRWLIGEYDDAWAACSAALQAATDPRTRVELLLAQARTLVSQGRLDEAMAALDDAAADHRRAGGGSDLLLCRLDAQRGWILSNQGDHAGAEPILAAVVRRLDESVQGGTDWVEVLAQALDYMGSVKLALDDLEGALEVHERALALREGANDLLGMVHSYNNIAEIYWRQERLTDSMDSLLRSLAVRRRIGNRYGLVAGLNNLGILYFHEGRLAEAEASYLESLDYARQIGSLQAVGLVLLNLVELNVARGDARLAHSYIIQARRALEQVGDQDALAELEQFRQQLEALQAAA